MACISKKSNDEQYGFKRVPEKLEDITAEWCEKALKIGNHKAIISQDTKVESVDVTRLQNEITGVMDGGGFSGSTLLRITLRATSPETQRSKWSKASQSQMAGTV